MAGCSSTCFEVQWGGCWQSCVSGGGIWDHGCGSRELWDHFKLLVRSDQGKEGMCLTDWMKRAPRGCCHRALIAVDPPA